MAQFCANCSSQFRDDLDFCPNCGMKIGLQPDGKYKRFATVSLIFGILGLSLASIFNPLCYLNILFALFLIPVLGLGVSGIALGAVSMKCTARSKAIAGFVLSVVAVAGTGASMIVAITLKLVGLI